MRSSKKPKSTAAQTAQPSANLQLARNLSEPVGAPVKPLTPKEFGAFINKTARWVCSLINEGKLPTLYPHRQPYQIPGNALFTFTTTAKFKSKKRAA